MAQRVGYLQNYGSEARMQNGRPSLLPPAPPRVPAGLAVVWAAGSSTMAETARSSSSMSGRELQDQSASGVVRHRCDGINHLDTSTSILEGEKKFECDQCTRVFKYKSDYQRHSLTHSGIKNFECQHCSKKFAQKPHLIKHWLTHNVGKYECQQCGKKFAKRSSLNRHTLKHNAPRNFECQHCGKRFTDESSLTRHILTHTGIKNYECQQCGRKFTQKPHLNRHTLTHNAPRNFECQQCGKRFIDKFSLTRHTLTHSGIRNFGCEECGKRFTQKSHLNKHSQTHTGVRKYERDDFGKILDNKPHLGKHALMQSGVRNYECQQFGKDSVASQTGVESQGNSWLSALCQVLRPETEAGALLTNTQARSIIPEASPCRTGRGVCCSGGCEAGQQHEWPIAPGSVCLRCGEAQV